MGSVHPGKNNNKIIIKTNSEFDVHRVKLAQIIAKSILDDNFTSQRWSIDPLLNW